MQKYCLPENGLVNRMMPVRGVGREGSGEEGRGVEKEGREGMGGGENKRSGLIPMNETDQERSSNSFEVPPIVLIQLKTCFCGCLGSISMLVPEELSAPGLVIIKQLQLDKHVNM